MEIGDKVKFLRQAVGYPTKELEGIIHSFGTTESIGLPRVSIPVVYIKADCEYGSALPYNHTVHRTGVTLLSK